MPRPGRFTHLKETWYSLYGRLSGPRGRFGRVRKISLPHLVGFEPITVQPVASRYTDCAIPPAVCRPKYPLKIQFLRHRKQTASPIQRRTFVFVLSTDLLMVGGKLASPSCCLLLYMFYTIIYIYIYIYIYSFNFKV